MPSKYKTWRSPVAIILFYLTAAIVAIGCKQMLVDRPPRNTPELLGELIGIALFALPCFIAAKKLLAKERTIAQSQPQA
jgi:hypothetical protein